MYYSYDFGKPSNHEDRFIYSHNKHNEVNLNLGLIKVNYERIMFEEFNGGDISSITWPRNSLYCKIYTANIGVKI
jgi:hypothetical protein